MNRLNHDNRGSGIASVVVAGAFLFLLVSSVAVGSNYAMRMKQTDTAARRDFYEVDAKYERLKVEIEQLVQDAVKEAYDYMLNHYVKGSEQAIFENRLADLLGGTIVDGKLRFTDSRMISSDLKMVFNQIDLSRIEVSIPDISAAVSVNCPYVLITEGNLSGGGSVSGSMFIAKDIQATRNTIELAGTMYVGDDLHLDGGSATLSGRYYGFGKSTTEGNESSAILIDEKAGRKASLDMSGLSALYLSGVAFIENGHNDLPIGGSVSAKADQLAFLVPSENVTYDDGTPLGNPYIYPAGETRSVVCGSLPAGASTVTYYDTTFGTEQIVYLLYKFNTQRQRNDWFAEYCRENIDKVSDYLNKYLSGYTLGAAPQSDGLYFIASGADYSVAGGGTNIDITPPSDVYMYLDWSDGITEAMEFQDDAGRVLAVVSNGHVTVSPVCKFVLTSESVTLSGGSTFSGIFVAREGVVLEGGPVVSYAALDAETLNAKCGGITLREFLTGAAVESGGGVSVQIMDYTKNGG